MMNPDDYTTPQAKNNAMISQMIEILSQRIEFLERRITMLEACQTPKPPIVVDGYLTPEP